MAKICYLLMQFATHTYIHKHTALNVSMKMLWKWKRDVQNNCVMDAQMQYLKFTYGKHTLGLILIEFKWNCSFKCITRIKGNELTQKRYIQGAAE